MLGTQQGFTNFSSFSVKKPGSKTHTFFSGHGQWLQRKVPRQRERRPPSTQEQGLQTPSRPQTLRPYITESLHLGQVSGNTGTSFHFRKQESPTKTNLPGVTRGAKARPKLQHRPFNPKRVPRPLGCLPSVSGDLAPSPKV